MPQVLSRYDHLLGRFDQQPGQANIIGILGAIRLDQLLRQHLDAQVDNLEAVVAQHDVHQVLADVVHVALDGSQNDLALQAALALLHVRFKISHRRLHHLGAEQHFGDDQFVVVEKSSHLGHAVHQRAVDDVHGGMLLEGLFEVGKQAVLAPLNHVGHEPLLQGQGDRRLADGGFPAPVKAAERADGVVAAPKQQVFGDLAFLLRNGGIALEPFRVDDGIVQPGAGAVVEKYCVQHLAAGVGQAK